MMMRSMPSKKKKRDEGGNSSPKKIPRSCSEEKTKFCKKVNSRLEDDVAFVFIAMLRKKRFVRSDFDHIPLVRFWTSQNFGFL